MMNTDRVLSYIQLLIIALASIAILYLCGIPEANSAPLQMRATLVVPDTSIPTVTPHPDVYPCSPAYGCVHIPMVRK